MYQQQPSSSEPPCDHFDPHVMLAERAFNIEPNEEILIVINGSGYRCMDDLIFQLRHDNDYFSPLSQSNEQLCFFVKNCSLVYTIFVGYKSSLKWLLDMPRLTSKMCHGLPVELTQYKYSWGEDLIVADDETLIIR